MDIEIQYYAADGNVDKDRVIYRNASYGILPEWVSIFDEDQIQTLIPSRRIFSLTCYPTDEEKAGREAYLKEQQNVNQQNTSHHDNEEQTKFLLVQLATPDEDESVREEDSGKSVPGIKTKPPVH